MIALVQFENKLLPIKNVGMVKDKTNDRCG